MSRPNLSKNYVILDSNIIQYFNNELLASKILGILRDAIGDSYSLAISDFTFFELLNGSTIKKEQEMVIHLNGITRFYVKKTVLVAAAHLGCLYKEDGMDPGNIDIGDLIIGASAVLSGSYVFTANIRDFPVPFFKVELNKLIEYEVKGAQKFLNVAFLKPDVEVIGKYHASRLKQLPLIKSPT